MLIFSKMMGRIFHVDFFLNKTVGFDKNATESRQQLNIFKKYFYY